MIGETKMKWLIFSCCSWVALLMGVAGCTNVGDCPSASVVTPGGSCTGDMLSCPYDLATPSPACDGTMTSISTSCVCTKRAWTCPASVSCPDAAAAADGGGADETGGDSSVSDDGGG